MTKNYIHCHQNHSAEENRIEEIYENVSWKMPLLPSATPHELPSRKQPMTSRLVIVILLEMTDQEVSRRISLELAAMNSVNKSIWRRRYLCRRTKLRVLKTLVLPILLYGSEIWTLSGIFCNKSLRRIMGSSWQDHVSNRRLHCVTGMGPVTCITHDRQRRLYGHLTRFRVDDPAHQVVSLQDTTAWRRPSGLGRPRKS